MASPSLTASSSQLLTTRQVAEILGYKTDTLRKWRTQGCGPSYIKIGSRGIRYLVSDIQHFIDWCLGYQADQLSRMTKQARSGIPHENEMEDCASTVNFLAEQKRKFHKLTGGKKHA